MVIISMDRHELTCLLDAVRLGLDDLRDQSLGSWAGGQAPQARGAAATYAHLRRLRLYLQRFAGVVTDILDLDFDADDQHLLAMCCLHSVAGLDRRVGLGADRAQIERQRDTLSTWCVKLAARRVEPLVPGRARDNSPAVQAIHREVQHRLMAPPEAPPALPTRDLPSLRAGVMPTDQAPARSRLPGPARPDPTGSAAEVDPVAAARLHAGLPPVPVEAAGAAGQSAPTPSSLLPDPRGVSDPRLRAIMELDLAAYRRAVDAKDHRLALALLAAIVDAAVLDYGLAHRSAIGLEGTPEGWNLDALIDRIAANHFTPLNTEAKRMLPVARHLLRPARQLALAHAITPRMRADLEEFACRIATAASAAR